MTEKTKCNNKILTAFHAVVQQRSPTAFHAVVIVKPTCTTKSDGIPCRGTKSDGIEGRSKPRGTLFCRNHARNSLSPDGSLAGVRAAWTAPQIDQGERIKKKSQPSFRSSALRSEQSRRFVSDEGQTILFSKPISSLNAAVHADGNKFRKGQSDANNVAFQAGSNGRESLDKPGTKFHQFRKTEQKKKFLKKLPINSYKKETEIRTISISLASPEEILRWAERTLPNGKIIGKVTNANTLHYKTFKPQKGGLFCERIFGPLKDFECACGKIQKSHLAPATNLQKGDDSLGQSMPSVCNATDGTSFRSSNAPSFIAFGTKKFCPNCDVEYTWSIFRRYQLGYIQLTLPVTHVWYLKGTTSILGNLLGLKKKVIVSVAYNSETTVLETSQKSTQISFQAEVGPLSIFQSWEKILRNQVPAASNTTSTGSQSLAKALLNPEQSSEERGSVDIAFRNEGPSVWTGANTLSKSRDVSEQSSVGMEWGQLECFTSSFIKKSKKSERTVKTGNFVPSGWTSGKHNKTLQNLRNEVPTDKPFKLVPEHSSKPLTGLRSEVNEIRQKLTNGSKAAVGLRTTAFYAVGLRSVKKPLKTADTINAALHADGTIDDSLLFRTIAYTPTELPFGKRNYQNGHNKADINLPALGLRKDPEHIFARKEKKLSEYPTWKIFYKKAFLQALKNISSPCFEEKETTRNGVPAAYGSSKKSGMRYSMPGATELRSAKFRNPAKLDMFSSWLLNLFEATKSQKSTKENVVSEPSCLGIQSHNPLGNELPTGWKTRYSKKEWKSVINSQKLLKKITIIKKCVNSAEQLNTVLGSGPALQSSGLRNAELGSVGLRTSAYHAVGLRSSEIESETVEEFEKNNTMQNDVPLLPALTTAKALNILFESLVKTLGTMLVLFFEASPVIRSAERSSARNGVPSVPSTLYADGALFRSEKKKRKEYNGLTIQNSIRMLSAFAGFPADRTLLRAVDGTLRNDIPSEQRIADSSESFASFFHKKIFIYMDSRMIYKKNKTSLRNDVPLAWNSASTKSDGIEYRRAATKSDSMECRGTNHGQSSMVGLRSVFNHFYQFSFIHRWHDSYSFQSILLFVSSPANFDDQILPNIEHCGILRSPLLCSVGQRKEVPHATSSFSFSSQRHSGTSFRGELEVRRMPTERSSGNSSEKRSTYPGQASLGHAATDPSFSGAGLLQKILMTLSPKHCLIQNLIDLKRLSEKIVEIQKKIREYKQETGVVNSSKLYKSQGLDKTVQTNMLYCFADVSPGFNADGTSFRSEAWSLFIDRHPTPTELRSANKQIKNPSRNKVPIVRLENHQGNSSLAGFPADETDGTLFRSESIGTAWLPMEQSSGTDENSVRNEVPGLLEDPVIKSRKLKTLRKKITKLKQLKPKLIRRIKLLQLFEKRKSEPDSMILKVLPVLPADLRPIMKLGDQIAASDLNRLYQRIIYRNDRLKKFLKESVTINSEVTRFAHRLLQEAVDNLIENGKSGVKPETDSRGRALKSLSAILKGKSGRFRQYLLGKRVDYSGRSVIVVGPKLKMHECGLPYDMAIELFIPFLLKRILNYNLAQTVVGAKTLIRANKPLTKELLREVMRVTPVLLNRAPTLHRLGIQAFQPILVDGKAILLHPLVCPAFNADFDGDQMAVHVPITVEARAEALKLMFSRNNLLSPATGDPLVLPSQDMVLGCYYLTTEKPIAAFHAGSNGTLFRSAKQSSGKLACADILDKNAAARNLYFNSFEDVLKKFNQDKISSLCETAGLRNDGRLSIDPRPDGTKFDQFHAERSSAMPLMKTNIESKSSKNLHSNIWMKWEKTVETGSDQEQPIEVRVNVFGFRQDIYSKVLCHYDIQNKKLNQYIRTTPGKIIFNLLIQKSWAFAEPSYGDIE